MAADINKLINDITNANNAASMYDEVEDGGSCNFDSPIINIKLTRKERESLKDFLMPVGLKGYKDWYFVMIVIWGQGNRRTAMAEAAAKYMKDAGYNASVYYEMD